MSVINPVANNGSASLEIPRNVHFRASVNQSNDIDMFIKQQREKEQKNAKRKQNVMYGLQAGAMLAIIASVIAAFRINGGMGKKQSELKAIWSDVSKSAKIDELALPENLNTFTIKFKNSIENPQALKSRDGKPVKSVLLYGPPGTGKTT